MGLVAKQSVSNTILMYVGVLIGYVNVTILFPRIIGEEGYGLTRVILSIVFIAQHFAMLGTPSMLLRFTPRFRDNGEHGLLRYAIGVLLTGIVLMMGILFLLKDTIVDFKRDDSPLIEEYYILTLPILAFVTLQIFLSNVCRAHLNSTLPVFVNDFLLKIFTTILLLCAAYYAWSFDIFLYRWTLLYASTGIFLAAYLIAKGYMDLRWDGSIGRPFVKESMDFSLFNMLSGASNGIISNIDIVMIGLLLAKDSLANAGLYAIMVYLANAAIMPTRGLSTIASPLIAVYAQSGDMKGMQRMYERTSLNQLITSGFLAFGIFICLPDLFQFMQIDYTIGMPVFVLIACTRVIQAGTGVNGIIMNFSPHYRYSTYFIAGLAVVAIGSNIVLIPKYGLLGAAFASLLSYGFFEFLKWIFIWKRLDLQPFNRRHLYVVLIGLLMIGLNRFIPYLESPILDILMRGSIMSLLAFIILMKTNLAPDLRGLVLNGLSRLGIKSNT